MTGVSLRFVVRSFLPLVFAGAFSAGHGQPTYLHKIPSYRAAKKLIVDVYGEERFTFYCGCDYAYRQVKGHRRGVIDPRECGFAPAQKNERSELMEWEHVVPASALGGRRECWRKGHRDCRRRGRKCCRRVDPIFRAMEADLHNLQPSIGEINQDRGNHSFGMIPGEARRYGRCDFELDAAAGRVEPRPEIRGDIARTYFYMERVYGLALPEHLGRMLELWHAQDPVDAWERERNRRIARIQGNSNPYIH